MKHIKRFFGAPVKPIDHFDASIENATRSGYRQINSQAGGVLIKNKEGEEFHFPEAEEFLGSEEFEPGVLNRGKKIKEICGEFLKMRNIDGTIVYYVKTGLPEIIKEHTRGEINSITVGPIQNHFDLTFDYLSLEQQEGGFIRFSDGGKQIEIRDLNSMSIN